MSSVTFEMQTQRFNNALRRFVAGRLAQADRIVFEQAAELLGDIVEDWPVDEGTSRAAWAGPTRRGHAHYRLSNAMPYAGVIEFGGYPGIGPKTIEIPNVIFPGGLSVEGGIFPSQKPAAPVRRNLEKRRRIMIEELAKDQRQNWGK